MIDVTKPGNQMKNINALTHYVFEDRLQHSVLRNMQAIS